MEQPSTSRLSFSHNNNEEIVPKRTNKRKNEYETPFGSKRTFTGSERSSLTSREKKKFSANTRLQSYRKVLERKQNQVVKVHTPLLNSVKVDKEIVKESCIRKSANNRLNKYKENALTVERVQTSNSIESNEECEMDWSPISEEQLLTDINQMRENITEILSHKSTLQDCIASEIPRNTYIFKDTFVIVDTNIFLSHLCIVEHLMNIKLNGGYRPFVLIPWIVIQELDYMKDGGGCRSIIQTNARKAVNFINKSLLISNSTLKGQSVIDATKHCIESNNPDDSILACCLQVFERGNSAILLSNDKNLRNKAIIHSVPAYSAEEIFKELEVTLPIQEKQRNILKSDDVKNHLTTLFNKIIHGEALAVYGEYYYKMGLLKDAPWNLDQCLVKIEKLWISIFSEKLPKHFLQNVQNFRKFLKEARGRNDSDHEELVDQALNICLHLKNSLKNYSELITDCINKIVKLK